MINISFASVYGVNAYLVRRILWRDLSFFKGPWVFWEILMLFSRLMTTKGGLFLIRFLVMNSLIELILMILFVCLSLDLVILSVMGGEGYTKLIKKLDRALCNGVCMDE